MDNDKHSFTSLEEVEKLLYHGEDWLATHPFRDLIIRRYLHQHSLLVQQTLNQLDKAASDCPKEDFSHTQEEVLEISMNTTLTKAADIGLTQELLEEIVPSRDKQRFAFSPTQQQIWDYQRHDVKVNLELCLQPPPAYLQTLEYSHD